MNLFAFYRDSVLEYLGQTSLLPTQEARYQREITKIQKSFGGVEPIDYSSEETRLAYMLYYAPKHAIIWREYVSSRAFSQPNPMHLNSIGTGCGAEIIGLLEGLGDSIPFSSDWWCHDIERAWVPLLNIVCSRYNRAKGHHLHHRHVPEITSLRRGGFTIGSMVLSEIVKQGNHRSVKRRLTNAIGPAEGWFLDISKCRDATTKTGQFLSKYYPFGYESLRSLDVSLQTIINDEISGCNPRWCLSPLTTEPSMLMFFPRFS